MRFSPTALPGVVSIEIERLGDERGYFARTWCEREAAAQGLPPRMVQDSVGHNTAGGTLRGMHYHAAGFPQARVMRCLTGRVHAVALDLRADSPCFLTSVGLALTGERFDAIYVPPGVALGYLTLEADTTVQYQMPLFYDPQFERGVRWNDPAFAIDWPSAPTVLHPRDAGYADFSPDMAQGLSLDAVAGEPVS